MIWFVTTYVTFNYYHSIIDLGQSSTIKLLNIRTPQKSL